MNIDIKSHPVSVLQPFFRDIALVLGSSAMLEFSYYKYQPQTLEDERKLFKVNITDVTPEWFFEIHQKIEEGYELAMHSRVWNGNEMRHMLMADMAVKNSRMDLLPRRMYLPSLQKSVQPHYFNSGRSFHSYVPVLTSDDDALRKFFCDLLIHHSQLFDGRWMGHRLLAGYAALRWSCNTGQYRSAPRLV